MSKRPAVPPGARAVTREIVRDALACISPDVPHDERVRLAFAVFDGLGSAGAELWLDWASQRSKPDAIEDRSTWKSAGKPGPVTVATLFGMAKEHGFRFPDAGAAPPAPDTDALEREAQQRQRARAEQEADYRRRADEAARAAVELWERGKDRGSSGYLKRKGVGAHGVRFLADGTLLVPMRTAAGELQNVQRIAPAKPTDQAPEKRFMPGGRKTGLHHWCGSPSLEDNEAVLLLAEGYATASSIYAATGRAVCVTFDAGNLVHVAKELRARHPDVPILVCGDDDRATDARTGSNTGREKAAKAVRAVKVDGRRAGAVFPEGLPDGGSDFNDLAQHAGDRAVGRLIDEACQTLCRGEALPEPQDRPKRAAGAAGGGRGGNGNGPPPDDAPTPSEGSFGGPFRVDEEGVWHVARDAEGNEKRPQWLCARLDVTARTRADDANGWGYLLEFADPDGNPKQWAMPSALLSGEGAEWAGRLRDMGLRMAVGTRTRNLIAQYIDTRDPFDRATCTDRVGWHGATYVLPSGSIGSGADGRRYVFQSESGMEDTFRRHGTLQEWRHGVARLCEGNSRLVFALCCAFAGPMLRLAGMESGGFHLRGDSSKGKTTALRVAASVWGRPSYMQRWRTTDNALEATAVQHCDGLLILDEFGQLDPRVAGECAYMLANDQEKGRATRGGLARRRRTWRLLFLSSGEVSLADHMAEAGKRTRAGQEVRMVDVPLDAGVGYGGLDTLHDHAGPAALADAIVGAAARFYGVAGRTWLEWASEHHDALPGELEQLVDRYRDDMVPEAASEQVRRVGSRFALVAAAGELATRAGITGWQPQEALRGVRQCFGAWLAARGHIDNGEDAAMLRQVRRFLELNGEGRFTWWHRALDDHASKTLNRAGFRRLLSPDGKPINKDNDHLVEYGDRMRASDAEQARVEYFVLVEVFRSEVCHGYAPEAVAKLLQRRGHLEHETGRLAAKHRLPGMGGDPVRCYHIKSSIFDDEL